MHRFHVGLNLILRKFLTVTNAGPECLPFEEDMPDQTKVHVALINERFEMFTAKFQPH